MKFKHEIRLYEDPIYFPLLFFPTQQNTPLISHTQRAATAKETPDKETGAAYFFPLAAQQKKINNSTAYIYAHTYIEQGSQ